VHRLLSAYGFYYPIQQLRRERISDARRRVARFWSSDAAVRAELRREWLAGLLESLWQVPYYIPVLRQLGFESRQPIMAEDLSRLPLLRKSVLATQEAQMVVAGSRMSWRRTSGSSGLPLIFRKDRDATAMMDAVMYDRYAWYGIEVGDPQARVWGRALGGWKRVRQGLIDVGMNRRRISTFGLTRQAVDAWIATLRRFKPTWIYAYPGALTTALELASPERLKALRDLPLKAVICTGEVFHPWQREMVRAHFDAPIVNEYGSTENGIIAFECRLGSMHVVEEALEIELEPSAVEGQGPSIVVTELHSRSVPFVRYALGDRVDAITEACGCGRAGRLLQGIVGREDSFIVLPDGRKIYDAVLAYALAGRVRQYRGRQVDVRRLEIDVVPLPGRDAVGADALAKAVAQQLDDALQVDVRLTDAIEPERSGKMRYFIPLDPAR
jgi:phenylacetate-CoA ligase